MELRCQTTGKTFRTSFRESDSQCSVAPFDRALHDVGRLTDGHNSYVRLQHARTGHQFARSLNTNRMQRIFRTN